MSTISQGTPFTDQGLERPYFFNGRVLTAEALRKEQAAEDVRLSRLAQAIGSGVLRGFDVSAASEAAVTVTAGVGVTRSGAVVELPRDVDVSVVSGGDDAQAATGGDFQVCSSTVTGGILSGAGLYLLTVSPAQAATGRAPAVGLEDDTASPCGSSDTVEGVCFHVVDARSLLDGFNLLIDEGDLGSTSEAFQNVIAHAGMGTLLRRRRMLNLVDRWKDALEDGRASSPNGRPDALDALRDAGTLPDDHLPLALFYWDEGLGVVEPWAVRRRLHQPRPAGSPGFPVDDLTLATGDAALRQFQTQVFASDLTTYDVFGTLHFLPPAGLIPLTPEQQDSLQELLKGLREAEREALQAKNELAEVSLDNFPEVSTQGDLDALLGEANALYMQSGALSVYVALLNGDVDDAFDDVDVDSPDELVRLVSDEEEPLQGELERADDVLDTLNGQIEKMDLEKFFSGADDALGAFEENATTLGRRRVQVQAVLGLPWWLVSAPLTVLPDAALDPLFDRALRQPPVQIPHHQLAFLQEVIQKETASARQLPRTVPKLRFAFVHGDLYGVYGEQEDTPEYVLFSVDETPETFPVIRDLLGFARSQDVDPIVSTSPFLGVDDVQDVGFITARVEEELKSVTNVGPKRAQVLTVFGIDSTKKLASIRPKDVATILEVSETQAESMVAEAGKLASFR